MIAHNHVSGGRDGIRIEKGHGNLVADNVVVHAGQAGITLGITAPLFGGETTLCATISLRGVAWMGSW